MATKKKLLQAAAGQAGGAGLNVEDVFSTYLYEGNGSTQTITNGIDLAGEGGLVWIKSRTGFVDHNLMDTERGLVSEGGGPLTTTSTAAQGNNDQTITSFNSNGFTVGTEGSVSTNGMDFASWTFRKAPKFFDVVTYTGDGNSSQTIPHNLGGEVGFIVVKKTSASGSWFGLHRDSGLIILNETGATYSDSVTDGYFGDGTQVIRPTSTHFTIGSAGGLNDSGVTLVAYLFAHNDGDGEFGPDGDADIIKCGSYTGNGTVGQEINLGFEPQFVMAKITNTTGNWYIQDAMRTMTGNGSPTLKPNSADAEYNSNGYTEGNIELTSTGFKLDTNDQGGGNGSGDTYIYIAIRRGTKVPESATEVFGVSTRNASEPAYTSGFPVDFAFARAKNIANNWDTGSRLQQGNRMFTNLTNAEATNSNMMFDYQEGWSAGTGASTDYLSWMWKRAPGFFDVVAYTGDGTYPRNIAHNLSATPEMVIIKARNWSSGNWAVHHKDLGYSTVSYLDNVLGSANQPHFLTASDASTFTVGSATSFSNYSNSASYNYIAYLFATLPGISKVGSYTGNGTSQTIDCGFTSGARFVLSKCVSHTGAWYVFDTERGIVSGNDRVLELDSSNPEVIYPGIDPQSSGFIVNDNITNESGRTFIFYAIA